MSDPKPAFAALSSRSVCQQVTAPSEAEPTRRAYLAMTPAVSHGLGAFHAASRFLISAAGSSTSRRHALGSDFCNFILRQYKNINV